MNTTKKTEPEKIIKGLECCTQHGSMCGCDCNGHWGWTDGSHTGMELLGEYRTKCPYGNCETGCVKTLAKDALALLKAQEPRVTCSVCKYSRCLSGEWFCFMIGTSRYGKRVTDGDWYCKDAIGR